MSLKNRMASLNPKNIIDGGKRSKPKPRTTLYHLKNTTKLANANSDKALQYWQKRNDYVTLNQRINVQTRNIKEGNVEFYNYYAFSDIINNLTDILVLETFDSIEFYEHGKEEALLPPFVSSTMNLTFDFDIEVFKRLFKYAWLYNESLLKGNVKNGVITFEALQPIQYQKVGDTYEFLTINSNGEIEKEPETRNVSSVTDVSGNSLNKTFCYQFKLNNRFYKKIEKLLIYDMISTSLPVEVELNKTKMLIDEKTWGENPVNVDLINLINVPESLKLGDSATNGYLQTMEGKNSLDQLVSVKREIEKDLVNTYRLSKKALGLDAGGQDFASSLPYENQMTAMTINSYRKNIENFLSGVLSDILGKNYDVDLSKYKLSSEEAITRANAESLNSNQMSISEAITRKHDLPLTDEFVRKEIVKIKIEKSIEMTDEEEQWASDYGLIPQIDIYDILNEEVDEQPTNNLEEVDDNAETEE